MKKASILLLAVLLLHFNSFAQKSSDIYSLSHPDSLQVKDFKQLKSFLKNKRIIVAGEANHGAREFYQVKKALLQYLVEEQNLRHFAIEANYASCQVVNDYVSGKKEGDVKTQIQNFYVWPFVTEEFADILVWMRSYNAGKPEKDQIKLWGFDMQQAYLALKALNKAVAEKTGKEVIELPVFDVKMKEIMYQPEEADLQALTSAVNAILPGHPEREELEMNLRLIERSGIFYKTFFNGDRKAADSIRDNYMAETAKEIIAGLGKDEKIMLWAHNSHIFKTSQKTIRQSPMGAFLKPVYKDEIYYIGFDFNRGSFAFPNSNQMENTLTVSADDRHILARRLDKTTYNLLFIPFTDKNKDIHTNAVGMRYNQGLIKATYSQLYDAVFFVKDVNPVTMIEK